MPTLSEILATPEGERSNFYYGVEVDVESFTPPTGLNGIAFLYKGQNGEIDDTLMDVIIAYSLAGIDITLEISACDEGADGGALDARYLLTVAANAGFSLSLLPPEKGDIEGTDAEARYLARLDDFAEAYFTAGNFGRFLYPVTSVLEGMFARSMGATADYKPTSAYARQRFHDGVDAVLAVTINDTLIKSIETLHGGPDSFEQFAKAMVYKLYKQAEENAVDLIAQHDQKQQQQTGEGAPGEAGGG